MRPSALLCFCPVCSVVLRCVFEVTRVHWLQHWYCCNAVPSFSEHTYDIPLRGGGPLAHLLGQEHAVPLTLTLLGPQSRFLEKTVKFYVICPPNGTAVLKGSKRSMYELNRAATAYWDTTKSPIGRSTALIPILVGPSFDIFANYKYTALYRPTYY